MSPVISQGAVPTKGMAESEGGVGRLLALTPNALQKAQTNLHSLVAV
jgi:hypothetical protein